jgi:hypothetical protein
MKAKLGTVLDRELLRRTRSIAAREGKRLNQVIEEALSEHLLRRSGGNGPRIVERTAGCLKLPKKKVDQILRDEPGIFDR